MISLILGPSGSVTGSVKTANVVPGVNGEGLVAGRIRALPLAVSGAVLEVAASPTTVIRGAASVGSRIVKEIAYATSTAIKRLRTTTPTAVTTVRAIE